MHATLTSGILSDGDFPGYVYGMKVGLPGRDVGENGIIPRLLVLSQYTSMWQTDRRTRRLCLT